jgi:DNA-binding HxlR family transcriptional regulator
MTDPDQQDFQTLLGFFKALGNESRLKIIAMLAEGECTVRELAQRLNLKEPTVSEHLAMLREAGLVSVRSEGNYRIYSFDAQVLTQMNRALLSRERLAALVGGTDDDQQVLSHFLDGERLMTIPVNRKKLLVVLRWLVAKFEEGRRYTEKEVSDIIALHHPDYATLRRELIGHKLMARDHGVYWRI